MDRNEEDRKFLHDIASPMTIVRHALRKLSNSFQDKSKALSEEECKRLLAKASDALQRIEELHACRKLSVSERELEDQKSQKKQSA